MEHHSKHIDLDDLWVGDVLRIVSSGKVVRYEGVGKDGKIRVKYETKILLVKPDNVVMVSDEELENKYEEFIEKNAEPLIPKSTKKNPSFSFTNELDLHIEKLNPDLENAHAQLILDHQLVMCRAFLNHSIAKKKNVVTIIHGIGTGVLKEEVLHLLKEFENVRFAISVNRDGAQEVWLKY